MEAPVPTKVAPQLPMYHFQLVASLSVPVTMLKMVEPPPHTGLALAETVGIVGSTHGAAATEQVNTLLFTFVPSPL